MTQAYPYGVEYGIGDGRRGRHERWLADAFGTRRICLQIWQVHLHVDYDRDIGHSWHLILF